MGLPACAQSPQAPGLLTVAAWNIEQLGERAYGQSPAGLAQHILLSGASVIALQEIHDTDQNPRTRTNTRLTQALDKLSREPGQDWEYRLAGAEDPRDTNLLTGVAWNKARVHLRDEWKLPLESRDQDVLRREPWAFSFSAGAGLTDFVVIPVHFKSNAGGRERATAIRAQEGRALAALLPQVTRRFQGEQDLIVAGDFNCLSHREAALQALARAGLRDLNEQDAVTYARGEYHSPLDRMFVPQDEREFRYSFLYVLTPADVRGHRGGLSDHFLVLTTLQVMDDDD